MPLPNLPLLPATPFTEGDIVSPEVMYLAMYAPIRDGQEQYLGHLEKINDSELSDVAGQIKPRLAAIENSLLVSVVSGLTLNVASGSIRLPSGLVQTIASTNLTAPNNATSFVWVDSTGALGIGATPPVVRVLLARVITSAGAVSTLNDLRHPAQRATLPITSSIKVFGGTNLTDKTVTAGEIFDQGLYYFRNFTVPSGITLQVDKYTKIFCSGTVNIQGTITCSSIAGGGVGQGAPANASIGGGISGAGIGAGSGSSGAGGQSYNYAAQPYGSGGGTGFSIAQGTGIVTTGTGGRGGGGVWIEASGAVTVGSSALISAPGTSGTPPGASAGTAGCSGTGGGSGGFVLLSSLVSVVLSAGATVDVRGGAGTAGINTVNTAICQGGGGGGGGVFVAASPSNNISGASILTAGGLAGTTVGSTAAPGVGGGGGGGFGGAGGGGTAAGTAGRIFLLDFVPIGS